MDRERTKELFARWATDYASDPIVRNARVDNAILEAASPKSGESALDFATGTGFFALEIARLVAPGQVVGIDVSPEMLEVARRIAQDSGIGNVRFQEAPPEGIPPSIGTVDLVTCCFALHHLKNVRDFMTRSYSILRPGGRIVIADICGNDNPVINKALIKLVQAHYDPTYVWNYSQNEMRMLFRRPGYQDIKLGWMPKLSYIGIHLADILETAKTNPTDLQNRMEGHLSENEQNVLMEWVEKTPRFEAEKVAGVFIASARKPTK